jgi:hypothetical protein
LARSDPDRFTALDLVAVSTLSVTIPAAAASVILLDPVTSASLNGLLVQAPPVEVDLADTEVDDIADNSPLGQLYVAIRQLPGMAPTRTSKLLASKRPGVVPIRDSVVSNSVQRWGTDAGINPPPDEETIPVA